MSPAIRPLAEGELDAAHACYRRIGFRLTADAEAPPFLQERVGRYRDTYGPQCLLRRMAPPA